MKIISSICALLILIIFSCKKEGNKKTQENLGEPVIEKFFNAYDTVGATLAIVGKNFSTTAKNNTVYFNSAAAQAFSYRSTKDTSGNDTLLVKVPAGAGSCRLKLIVYSNETTSQDSFFVTTGRWQRLGDFPGGGRFDAFHFAVGTKGYIGGGANDYYYKDLWEFDATTNSWTQKADFPGGVRFDAMSFVINNKAYVGSGSDSYNFFTDFYEYDPDTNTWTRKADIPAICDNGIAIAVNGKGYFITGAYSREFYEYDPLTDTWTQKADFPGLARVTAGGFAINNNLYIGAGNTGGVPLLSDFWQYNTDTDKWTQLTSLPSAGDCPVALTVNNKGYMGLFFEKEGYGSGFYNFDPMLGKWTMNTTFPGEAYGRYASFVANNRLIVTCGIYSNTVSAQTWEFKP